MRRRPNRPKCDEQGIFHLPLLLSSLIIATTGLALWGMLHHWKGLAQTQLRLDRCTGEAALELKGKLERIRETNTQMIGLRTAEMAAPLPPAKAALQAAVDAAAFYQEALRTQWTLKQSRWLLTSGCESSGDRSAPLPTLSWTRKPPDSLGAFPLDMNGLPRSFYFAAMHPPRSSAAEVFSGGTFGGENDPISNPWHARWIAPHGLFRPGIR